MRNRASLKVVLLGLLTLALAPGYAAAAGQGQDLTEMLASSAAVKATAVSGPIIDVSPLSLSFGVVDNGTSSSLDLTIMNIGDQTLNWGPTASSDPSFSGGASGTLAPGASAIVGVMFSPVDGGTHAGTLTIPSNATNGTQLIAMTGQGNAPPTLAPIGDKAINAFGNLTFGVSATDTDDTLEDGVTVTMSSNLPPGPTFDGSTFSWSPTDVDAGTYSATFTASDGRLSDAETINITVVLGNRPPVANAGGNYAGATCPNPPGGCTSVQFDGSGSDDPDGDALFYFWSFGDGGTSTSQSPAHPYLAPSDYIASLEVCDRAAGDPDRLCASDVAAVQIRNEVLCQILLKNNGSTIRTNGGGFELVGIEETEQPLSNVILSSIKMSAPAGSGSVSQILAETKGAKFGDLDGDLVQDLDVKFTRANISALLSNVPNNGAVVITVSGFIAVSGGTLPFRGTKTITVKSGGGAVQASAYPNPFNPVTMISYFTKNAGPVTMRIYSIDGRLVRTLKDSEQTSAGTHEVRWDGMDNAGRRVPSSVYFVKTSVGAEHSIFKLAVTK